jgi:predicted nucleotidyltransferase component of viral defense system
MDPARLDEDAILTVLQALSADRFLFDGYALKGGTALRLAHHTPRASVDIDLTSIERFTDQPTDEGTEALDRFCDRLDAALASVRESGGFTDFYVQRRRLEPGNQERRTFPAFDVTLGYSRKRTGRGPYSDTVGLDVSLNDVVCEAEIVRVGDIQVHASTLNDIVAEKLRALLQQVVRDRYRPGDVFDLWFLVTRAVRVLDRAAIATYLVEKSEGKEGLGPITKTAFHDPEVRERAAVGYAEIRERLPPYQRLPPFEEAFDRVLAFVGTLPLPAGDLTT